MDLSPYKEIINEKSKKYETFGYNSTAKALAWALILVISLFYGIIQHGWIGFGGSVFLSIITYFLLGIGADTSKRHRIERNVKQEVIIPIFKQRLPGLKFEESRSHLFAEVKSAKFFSSWFKQRHLSGENLLFSTTEEYELKMSEIKVSGISERYPLFFISVEFQGTKFLHKMYIRPKSISFERGNKKSESYMLFFKEPLPLEILVDDKEMTSDYYLSAEEKSADQELHDAKLLDVIRCLNKTGGKISPPEGTKIFMATNGQQLQLLIMNFNLYRFAGMTPMNQLNTVENYDNFIVALKKSIDTIVASKKKSI